MDRTYFIPKVLQIYLKISRYPILGKKIRERMRDEIFARGIISEEAFEYEVYQNALRSQEREGLSDPFGEEPPHEWNERIHVVRSQLTDFYFAHNLPHRLFESIMQDTLEKLVPDREVDLTFNPELAPWDLLFAEGDRYETLTGTERTRVEHHLQEIKAVLIKSMISSDRRFIALGREALTMADLRQIRSRRIGRGKIGGKAGGMYLAWKLLLAHSEGCGCNPDMIQVPESYYIGSDVYYEVHEINQFFRFMNQKYRSQADILAEQSTVYESYMNAKLPEYVVVELRELLEKVGQMPLIFRSSSLLEDSFETSFAGKYDSFFLPNQGTLDENLEDAKNAIRKIYASTLSPDALIYRQRLGLIDYDERMAILVQKVVGERHGRYYFPAMAGVGFSRNPFRWHTQIRREDGLLRLVSGLGTRAVDRVAHDYPRMIALSHPHLRPEQSVKELRHYSQRLIDVIDLEANQFKTLPIPDVVTDAFPALRLIAAQLEGDHLQQFYSRPRQIDPERLVFTFDLLLQNTTFATQMCNILTCLQTQYKRPVDIEYAVEVDGKWPDVDFRISLLQCRPLSQHDITTTEHIPTQIQQSDKLFTSNWQVPEGIVKQIRYIVYVKPSYLKIVEKHRRLEVGRVVGRLNEQLENEQFILMGPGRWGTSDIYLGVKVTYADIYNAKALIEVAIPSQSQGTPEMAYGTHFFQDLVEARIFPLALYPDKSENFFNWDFFGSAPNVLAELLPDDADFQDIITVIDVPMTCDSKLLEIVMSTQQDEAVAFLKRY